MRSSNARRLELEKLDELEEVYACRQVLCDHWCSDGTPSLLVVSVVAFGDWAAVNGVSCKHGYCEPSNYDSGLCVWDFEDMRKAIAMRDDFLALSTARCAIVQLFYIDDPYRSVGPARGVAAATRVRALPVGRKPKRRQARLYSEHCEGDSCRKCG
jgi:hypothetical protein